MARPPTMRHLVVEDEPVRARHAAERLGVTMFDVYCMIEWGEIVGGPHPENPRGCVAVPAAEIDRVIAAGGAPNYFQVLEKYGTASNIPKDEADRLSKMHETLVACAPVGSSS